MVQDLGTVVIEAVSAASLAVPLGACVALHGGACHAAAGHPSRARDCGRSPGRPLQGKEQRSPKLKACTPARAGYTADLRDASLQAAGATGELRCPSQQTWVLCCWLALLQWVHASRCAAAPGSRRHAAVTRGAPPPWPAGKLLKQELAFGFKDFGCLFNGEVRRPRAGVPPG